MTILASGNGTTTEKFVKERIEVVFTHNMKYADLNKIKEDLLAKGIVIEYLSIEFDKNKNLKMIEFEVDCKDGFSGKAKTSQFSKDQKFGFYRDYTEKSKTPFGVGFFKS